MSRPRLFIGSSTEGLPFARAARRLLDSTAEVNIWDEGFFVPGTTFIETLVNRLSTFDFAALILTPDDLLISRNEQSLSPRDNVLFELGLFMGALGRDHTFVIRPADQPVKLPSDLAGLVTTTYQWPRNDENYDAALGHACDQIRPLLQSLGPPRSRVVAQVNAVESRQYRQQENIDALAFVVTHFLPQFEWDHLLKLDSLEAFPYEMHPRFANEIRHLHDLGFIRKKHDFHVANMPPRGRVRDFFEITPAGRTFIALRQQNAEAHRNAIPTA